MIKRPTQNNLTRIQSPKQSGVEFSTKVDNAKPLIHHVHELRNRLVLVVVALLVASGASYFFHEQLIKLVQKPLGKTLYFTSPAGGLNFLIKLCLTVGVIVVLPVLFYQIVKFFYPLLEQKHKKAVIPYILASVVLAYGGVIFAYLVSLPNALLFLTGFGGSSLTALITVDEYYNFVLAYLLGFALIFQMPIIILFINRIKPQKPGDLMKIQRYIILGSFVVAAILTPTPDPINQTIMALPAVLLYQISVFMVWRINRRKKNVKERLVLTDIPSNLEFVPAISPVVNTSPVIEISRPQVSIKQIEAIKQTEISLANSRRQFVSDIISRPKVVRKAPVRPVVSRPPMRFMDVVAY